MQKQGQREQHHQKPENFQRNEKHQHFQHRRLELPLSRRHLQHHQRSRQQNQKEPQRQQQRHHHHHQQQQQHPTHRKKPKKHLFHAHGQSQGNDYGDAQLRRRIYGEFRQSF